MAAPTEPAPGPSDAARRAAVANAPLAVIATDERGGITVWNPAAVELFGWPRDEVIGRPLSELGIIPDEEATRFQRLRRAAMRGDATAGSIDGIRRRRDGSSFDARIWPAPTDDAASGRQGFLAYVVDVTEEKRRQAQHRADEARFRTIFAASHDAIFIIDPVTDQILDANPRGCQLLETDLEALRQLPVSQLVDADEEQLATFLGRVREQGVDRTDALVLTSRNGASIPCETSASWIDLDGRPAIVAMVRDVRDRRRMEAELRTAEERYRDLYENAPFAYFSSDRDGVIRMANRSAFELLARDDLIGTYPVDLYTPDHPDGQLRAQEIRDRFVAGQPIRNEHLQMLTGDGRTVWVSLSATEIHDHQGQVIGSRSVAEDITARKAAERQLSWSLQELRRANTELSQMAFGVAHDLAAPLRTVSSYTKLLWRRYEEVLDQDAADLLGFITDGVDRLNVLLDGVTAFARAGEQPHAPEQIDVCDLVDRTRRALHAIIEESGATIDIDELPSVWADPSQLAHIFQNLIANGIRFHAPDESPVLRLSARREPEGWRFDVADRGPGIDPAAHDRIFEMFQRAHDPRDRRGSGIGLAICRRAVERHGGRIWVTSTPGEGSTFHFTIPDRNEHPNRSAVPPGDPDGTTTAGPST